MAFKGSGFDSLTSTKCGTSGASMALVVVFRVVHIIRLMIAGHGSMVQMQLGCPPPAQIELGRLGCNDSHKRLCHHLYIGASPHNLHERRDVWGLVLNTHVVAALVRWLKILLVTIFATDALIILKRPGGAQFSALHWGASH